MLLYAETRPNRRRWLHLSAILRGTADRAAVFFDDEDRRFFLHCLAEAADDAHVAMHRSKHGGAANLRGHAGPAPERARCRRPAAALTFDER
jgi:hypothetical protein